MKANKLLPVLLPVALAGSVVYKLTAQAEISAAYTGFVEEARHFVKHEVLYDGMENYIQAIQQTPSLELSLESGQVYLNRQMADEAVNWYEEELLPVYYDAPETYEYGVQAYLMMQDMQGVFTVFDDYNARGLHSDIVEQTIAENKYAFYLKDKFEQVTAFSPANGAVVGGDGLWGIVNASGNMVISQTYPKLCAFTQYAAAVDHQGRAIYLDEEERIRITGSLVTENDPDFGQITEFKPISDGLIPACNGKVWNFYDSETYTLRFGGFRDVTCISNGVGGVSNGDGWAIIDSTGQLLTDYIYDEILVDPTGSPCHGDSLVVMKDEAYYLADKQGNVIAGPYDNAEPFNDDTYTAVEKNGEWGFVNHQGEEALMGKFDGVHAFSNTYAAVCMDDRWGYIDGTGETVIDYQFQNAGAMSSRGSAFVLDESGFWRLMILYLYQH